MLARDPKGNVPQARNFSLASDIVELLVYTTDDAFLQALREAVGGARRLWHVPSADKISDLLLAGQVGILVLDIQSEPGRAGAFVSQVKRQFQDLVVVAAGNREAETALAKLISDGVVYRFIHKPMSPARAKLFADAAVRRYEEQRRQVRPPPPEAAMSGGQQRRWWIAGVAGAGILTAVLAAWALRHRSSEEALRPLNTAAAPVPSADMGTPAIGGPLELRERLMTQAENALLEERLDEAAGAIAAARRAGADEGRLLFLSSQLARRREQLKAAAGSARPLEGQHTAPAASAEESPQKLLGLAAERIKNGHLIDPVQDSALLYIQAAMKIDPNSNATQAGKQMLAKALMAEMHESIDHRDFARSERLLEAGAAIVAPANLDSAGELLRSARTRAQADLSGQLLKTARERLQQDQLVEPRDDSAKHYLAALRDADPGNAGLAPAVQELGERMVVKARQALDAKQNDAARNWMNEAASIGYSSPESSAVQQTLNAPPDPKVSAPPPVDAAQLTLVKSVKPEYPVAAKSNNIQGWVELEFTVTETGKIASIVVLAASPPGVFDRAAVSALSKWMYQPVLLDDKPVARRARIRMRFALSG